MKTRMRTVLLIVAGALIAVAPALAGSAVIGSVAGSLNATLDGQTLMPKATVFSGDSLRVQDGAAVVAVGQGGRLVFGRETVASFLRDGSDVTVLLGQGNVSLYQEQTGVSLRVKVGTVTVAPTGEFKTLGEVAMVNGAVVVTAKEGKLRVEGNGSAVDVVKGKTITVNGRPERAPVPQGGAGVGASTVLQVGAVAGSATSSVLSGVAISRAGDARDAAATANDTAAGATIAANNAQAAATAAGQAANAAGCALNVLVPEVNGMSPYTPPPGFSCD